MNLVVIKNNQATTTSNKIAEVFGKQHKNVIKAINRLVGQLRDNELKNEPVNFLTNYYIDEKGEKRPQYIITRDGFTLLAMGFTGAKALQFKLKYIQAFNEMEEKLKAKSLPARDYWEVDDAELLRCLHAWHYTKSKADTLKFRKLHDENEAMKAKLLQLQALLSK